MKTNSTLSLVFLLFSQFAYSQSSSEAIKNWQHDDPATENFHGIATHTVYSNIDSTKPFENIIVAVIDGGTDSDHEDLKLNLWTNDKEIDGNGIDDDHNGYIDDIHGWNFIGGKEGDVGGDNIELTRLYKEGKLKLPKNYKWRTIKKKYQKELKSNKKNYELMKKISEMLSNAEKITGKTTLTGAELRAAPVSGTIIKLLKKQLANVLDQGIEYSVLKSSILEGLPQVENALNYHTNTSFDTRKIVGDNYTDLNEHNYGNNHYAGPDALHGTHVAGIIGAIRNNSIGIDGIADHVKIMIVRAIPDGDERDKDVANSIRYAVDNGAKIINMSFGKSYSPYKKAVDDAVLYAQSKNVLIIHAAGNESSNNDKDPNFPTPMINGIRVNNWIEVGASDPRGNAASFSNYGKNSVDLFAPGLQIYSTLPLNKYGAESGTSMASPVVAGVAALVWSHYPKLTLVQLKSVLLSSSVAENTMTIKPGSRKKTVPFSSLSITGGIINAEKAMKNAAKITQSHE